jgi:hypothetical protein
MDTAGLLAITAEDLAITRLGTRTVDTPLRELLGSREETIHYVTPTDRVLLDDTLGMARRRPGAIADLPAFNPGGPREKLFFDPTTVTAGVVTCGGLCPGLNNVIRGLVSRCTSAELARVLQWHRLGDLDLPEAHPTKGRPQWWRLSARTLLTGRTGST